MIKYITRINLEYRSTLVDVISFANLYRTPLLSNIPPTRLISCGPIRSPPHPWSQHASDGETYFYNSVTGESVWEDPNVPAAAQDEGVSAQVDEPVLLYRQQGCLLSNLASLCSPVF